MPATRSAHVNRDTLDTVKASHRTALVLTLLGVSIAIASVPAWTGSYVYDDFRMRESRAMDGLEDLWLVFQRTSYDYFDQAVDEVVTGATYRPLAHLTLIAVQVLGAGDALLHHLVSLAFHLTFVVGAYLALARRGSAALALLLTCVLGLHPLAVEAYGWINGRADVLSGASVAALAALSVAPARRSAAVLLVAAALCAAAAALAKETAILAVLTVAVASALPRRGLPSLGEARAQLPVLAGSVLGVAGAIGLRAALVGLAQAGGVALAAQHGLAPRVARLFREALISIAVPLPRTMASLAWELSEPLTTPELLLLLLAAAGVVLLALTRHGRALLLLLGAAATLAPTVLVSSSFWCGFDRYLYMPLLLVALALVETPLGAKLSALGPRTLTIATAVLALVLVVGTFFTARHYQSQAAFMASMIQLRPDDPSGYLFGAAWLAGAGQQDAAARMLESVPKRGLPRPLASALVTRLARSGRRDEAIVVLDDMAARYPDDPYALYDVVVTSIQRGDLTRAFAAAERLRGYRGFCDGVRSQLARALARPGIDHARVGSFRDQYTCS